MSVKMKNFTWKEIELLAPFFYITQTLIYILHWNRKMPIHIIQEMVFPQWLMIFPIGPIFTATQSCCFNSALVS